MATKRACPEAATVLSLPHVLTSIVQCLQSPRDALVFLSALPLTSLDAPLAATKELLTRPGRFVHTWPHLSLDELDSEKAALALAALPALVSLCKPAAERVDWSPSTTVATMSFVDFISSWPLKMTYFESMWFDDFDTDVVCSLLRRCTRLQAVRISRDEDIVDLLAAVTTPAHRVEKLSLFYTDEATMDWTSLLRPWLSSGHARHLSFETARATDVVGLARALATTSSLTSLDICNNDDLVQAFLTLQLPLHQLMKVHLVEVEPERARRFLRLCDVAKLTSLEIVGEGDHEDTLALVPRMPALRHLSLRWGELRLTHNATSRWPHLESLELCAVHFDDKAFDTVLAYLERVQGLQKIMFNVCHSLETRFLDLSRTLVRLINNGLTRACLSGANLDDTSAALLALTLRQCRNVSPVTFDLGDNDFSMDGVRVLLEALATCTCVCVRLTLPMTFHGEEDRQEDEVRRFLATHKMTCDVDEMTWDDDDDALWTLYSPSTHGT
ncbi:hypothetical protein SPRG_14220 [Saprolegnia parasitica CBS 223.65]|uniref:Uncharacterized protein n=1 Tax=Saprolegnia parasitica (strain CBS 223.65) TaxID=695850 RepID=A0A067BZT0_SAPPC|nr:hypothetical protein SPRG_14220 [Saprolegnia parasitica CBS 223.65]KDO20072.1 hypothetical protein SPRG_14220 [Saprolegnia parasitica CBS 223.65]|eukprot:XP_012209232.1 hypothetical protein SPRG_14220 [Saprolegnia parasitica CBS 223.65]